MSAIVPIDIRYELDEDGSDPGSSPLVRPIPSCASARAAGDLARLGRGDESCCLTFVPGPSGSALDCLANAPANWRGIVRVVPGDWGGEAALLPWVIDEVAAGLASIGRALLIEVGNEMPPWAGLHRLASTFTTLTIVLGGGPRTPLRLAFALCEGCPNVLLESSALGTDDLRETVPRLGAQRIVFGSATPTGSPAEALRQLDEAGLDEGARRLVLVENAEQLLTGAGQP
jgi:hypothetical protein